MSSPKVVICYLNWEEANNDMADEDEIAADVETYDGDDPDGGDDHQPCSDEEDIIVD